MTSPHGSLLRHTVVLGEPNANGGMQGEGVSGGCTVMQATPMIDLIGGGPCTVDSKVVA